MKIMVLLFFVLSGLICGAQNELYIVSKTNEADQRRISKGSFLRIRMASGKKHSGTMVKVQDFYVVLMRRDAVIDIEEVATISIQYRNATANTLLFPGGALFNEVIGKKAEGRFSTKYWTLQIRKM